MADKRPKAPTLTTPVGIFKWPKVTKIDYGTEKFPKVDGEFNLTVILNRTDPAVITFLAKCSVFMDEAEAAAPGLFAKLGLKARKTLEAKNKDTGGIVRNEFFSEVYDEETEEVTGQIEMKFKMQASGIRKKDGTKWSAKPGLFDAKMNPLPKSVDIWGGSSGKVSFETGPYFVEGTGAYGIQRRLKAVQVTDLVSAGQRTAAQYGFEEEEGFDAADLPPPDEDDEPAQRGRQPDAATDEAAAHGDF